MMRTPGRQSSAVMPRRSAHWMHRVTDPESRMSARSASRGAEPASSKAAARPGTASQAASPVSQSDTEIPELTAAAATVKACAHRSGSSVPAVDLTSKRTEPSEVMDGRLPHMVDSVYTGLLVASLAIAGLVSLFVVFRMFKGGV